MTNRITQAEFARQLRVNRSTVHRWIASGRIQADDQGLIDPDAARVMREATESPLPHHQARKAQFDEAREASGINPQEKAAQAAPVAPATGQTERNAPASEPMPAMEKLGAALKLETWRLQKAKAELANVELDKAAGALAERAELDYVLADFGNTLRGLMEGLPDRLAPALAAHRGDVGAIHKDMEDTARDLLTEMSDHMKRKMEAITQ